MKEEINKILDLISQIQNDTQVAQYTIQKQIPLSSLAVGSGIVAGILHGLSFLHPVAAVPIAITTGIIGLNQAANWMLNKTSATNALLKTTGVAMLGAALPTSPMTTVAGIFASGAVTYKTVAEAPPALVETVTPEVMAIFDAAYDHLIFNPHIRHAATTWTMKAMCDSK